jgi:hypothetical protein
VGPHGGLAAGRGHGAPGIESHVSLLEIFRAGNEGTSGDIRKRHHHVKERDPDEKQKRASGGPSELFASDFCQRTRPVPDRSGETAKVMNRPDEHDPQTDPQKARQPAEGLTGQDRAGDGTRRSNGRKMLGEEIEGTGGYVVHPVLQGHRRSGPAVIDLEPARHPTTIKAVGGAYEKKKADSQERKVHGTPSSR